MESPRAALAFKKERKGMRMKEKFNTVEEYLASVPEERRPILQKLREVIQQNLPPGFQETINYGMIGYVVPHSLYPPGYHCDPKLPLPFMNLANQKHYIGVYHMGLYARPDLLAWFQEAWQKQCPVKLDMSKSCIRLKKMDRIPYALIGELASKMTVVEWIQVYENQIKKGRR